MTSPAFPPERVDRSSLSIVPLHDDSDERHYWHSRSVAERLRHVELLRRINYGDRATGRLERVIEMVPLERR
jgi:hypothetical protein